MASRLNKSPKIWTLARDLGLKGNDPTSAIRDFCEKRIAAIVREFSGCDSLSQLTDMVRGRLETTFEVIRSDEDLQDVRGRYVAKGEVGFANLKNELSGEVFGITFQRRKRDSWEPRFVSVIDCRGEKASREYFTKWHELAHLICLTDQLRLAFRRTHSDRDSKDPEESMMDIVAGHLGFLPSLVRPHIDGKICFDKIDSLKARLCPEASRESALTGFVQAWPTPVILIKAELALRKDEIRQANQMGFGFASRPVPALRAVTVIENGEARRTSFRIHPRMRVPERSILHSVFEGGSKSAESDENLGWWESSDGTRLPSTPIHVKARRAWEGVEGLITPA